MFVVSNYEFNKDHVRKVDPRVYVRKRCLSSRESILVRFGVRRHKLTCDNMW